MRASLVPHSYQQCFDDYRKTAMFNLAYLVIGDGNVDLVDERGVELMPVMLSRSLATR